MSLTILIDYLMMHSFKGRDNNAETVQRTQLDEGQDVKDHQAFAKTNWQNSEYPIKSNELYKVYGNGVAAVNKNTFCVKKGEVFALLGPNGAGKSTMFNIMTMDLKRTSGDVQILNTDLDNINVGVQGHEMGMCP
jgi:ABC-type transport system involved in cytochrome bd biosynthesis fused ATPase/permease subunit